MKRHALLLAFSALTGQANAGQPIALSPARLAETIAAHVGHKVRVSGCVASHMHGMQIEPCGSSDWRELVALTDADEHVWKAMGRIGLPPMGSAWMEVEGTVVNEPIVWPKPGTRLMLRVDKVLKVHRLAPNNSSKPTPLRGAA
ncbi:MULTISPECIES: hypothetical protein [Lysobacteraceae]|uniref:hypothetical protein n=1 Tax=Cognatilysobacter terrigena TaxID=2488749 RepID=UPI00105CD511|nr:hypothetical protein [Lysobacter terrigena]